MGGFPAGDLLYRQPFIIDTAVRNRSIQLLNRPQQPPYQPQIPHHQQEQQHPADHHECLPYLPQNLRLSLQRLVNLQIETTPLQWGCQRKVVIVRKVQQVGGKRLLETLQFAKTKRLALALDGVTRIHADSGSQNSTLPVDQRDLAELSGILQPFEKSV